jgi:carbamoyl-phosphate synthase large subunit
MKICLTSSGRRVELGKTLLHDARQLGQGAQVVAVDVAPQLSAACQWASASFAVPRCTAPDYVEKILAICRAEGVKILVPTIDTELPILSTAHERFRQAGVHLVISQPAAVQIARDKQLTAEVLAQAGVPSPRTARLADFLSGLTPLNFPLILKQVDGSSSIGLHAAANLAELHALNLEVGRYVAQEKLEGPEYTVNCFVDSSGALRAVVPHCRIETRGGEVSKGVTERRSDLQKLAEQVVQAVPGLRGPFCFQVILTGDGPKVFEINARFGGGYPLAHAAGATFGKWIIEEALGLPTSVHNNWQDGLLMLRYDAGVFVPQVR